MNMKSKTTTLLLLALVLTVALSCTSDADCGTADQLGYCDTARAVCQCGVGWQGNLAVDPSSCTALCLPPAVPDSVVFLKEPIITLEANAGKLDLTVDLDVYLKQTPPTVAYLHPEDGTPCNILPGKLGTAEITQSVDGLTCDTQYIYSHNFDDQVNDVCWEQLAPTQETVGGYSISFNNYKTMLEVIQSGRAPFGQAANKRQDETDITRLFRRNYTVSVATRFSIESDQFSVLAGGDIRYRLVVIDYDLQNDVIRAVVETQTPETAKLINVAFDDVASSGLAPHQQTNAGINCDPASEPGFCNQFHELVFSDDPCLVASGEIVLSVEMACADGSDPSTCGFTNLPAGNVYSMDNLLVDYDACPRVITYGVDAANSFLRLHEDSGRSVPLSTPTVLDSVYYGQLSIAPAGDATFQAVTLNSISIHQVASPANIDLGDQLSSTFMTLISNPVSNDPLNPLWNFDLEIDSAFFAQAETYFLEASVDLIFTNTGPLTKKLRLPLTKSMLISHAKRAEGDEEAQNDQLRSSTFRMQAPEGKAETASSKSNTAIIAVAAGVGCLALVGVVLIVFLLKRRNSPNNKTNNDFPSLGKSSESPVEV